MPNKKERKEVKPATCEATIKIANKIKDKGYKYKSKYAVKAIKKFVSRQMKTSDVRLDVRLNHEVWKNGKANPPRKIRVRMERKRNEEEDAKHELYTLVSYVVPEEGFSGLKTQWL